MKNLRDVTHGDPWSSAITDKILVNRKLFRNISHCITYYIICSAFCSARFQPNFNTGPVIACCIKQAPERYRIPLQSIPQTSMICLTVQCRRDESRALTLYTGIVASTPNFKKINRSRRI